jgi:hypothetical protein
VIAILIIIALSLGYAICYVRARKYIRKYYVLRTPESETKVSNEILCVTTTPLEPPVTTPVPTHEQVARDLQEFDAAHKARYANNHAKRDKTGKFAKKRKSKGDSK